MRGTAGIVLVGALVFGGCGAEGGGVSQLSPPVSINLTVYINDSRVSLSPDSVGAGPVVLIVTNQASSTQSLKLLPAGAPAVAPLASIGPISPRGTAQAKVFIRTPGDYALTTAVSGALGTPPGTTTVQAATLHIGPRRPSGSSDLLQP
ncbi:MAG: hypothetical protein M3018_11635 [Actinomycetota bacterium]|nr:hypothetical protein [Actinomycetota bacterium]